MDAMFSLQPVGDNSARRCSIHSNVCITLTTNPSTFKATTRKRRQMALAAIISTFFIVVSLTAVILALHYKIVPLGRTVSLQRTRCFVTKIDREVVNVSSADSTDTSELHVTADPVSQSHTCIWVNVVYEGDNHVLLPGVLMDHPFRRTNTSKCLRGFYQSKSLTKASAFANDDVLWTPSKIVTVGQKVWCYRHNYNKPIYDVDNIKKELQGERRTMFLTTMRMILPPTLLFIAGFICLFFSCIYWQRYS